MGKITLDNSLRIQLGAVESQVELCDAAGHVIGYFLSAEWHRKMMTAWAMAQVSDEALEQARRQKGGRPLSEVIVGLGASCVTPS